MVNNIEEYRTGYEAGQAATPIGQLGDAFFAILDSEDFRKGYADGREGRPFSPNDDSGEDPSAETDGEAPPSSGYGYSDSGGGYSAGSDDGDSRTTKSPQPLHPIWRLLLYTYLGICGAGWIVYMLIVTAMSTGLISKQTTAEIMNWASQTVESPTGFTLILVFGIGLIVTGLMVAAFIVIGLLPLLIVLVVVVGASQASMAAASVIAVIGLVLLAFYYRWLYQKSL